MLFSSLLLTTLSSSLVAALPAVSDPDTSLATRSNDFLVEMCTNFVDPSNPNAQNPCQNFIVPSFAIDNDFSAETDTSSGLCSILEQQGGGGCPSSVQILQTGSCVFSTGSSSFGGCCTPGTTTQVVSSSDGSVNLNVGDLNDNVNCIQCSVTENVDFCGPFNDG